MTDDDLTRALEAWAEATDPAADPIPAEVVVRTGAADGSAAGAGSGAGPRLRRLPVLAAAAVLAVVVAVAAVVALRGDDPDAPVVTDAEAGAARTQVVVEAALGDAPWTTVAHRVVLVDPEGDEVRAAPLEAGTSLVADEPLRPGRWTLLVQRFDCTGDGSEDCGWPSRDGTPQRGPEPGQCALSLDVGPAGGRIVAAVATAPGRMEACGLPPHPDPSPTVPPAWTLRPDLPWSCGAASAYTSGRIGGRATSLTRDTLTCFADAVDAGTPVEIPWAELRDDDRIARSWLRSLADPVDGRGIEVIRDRDEDGEPRWVRARCAGVQVLEGNEDRVTPEGGITGREVVTAELSGCTGEEVLPLDLPDLSPAPSPTEPIRPPTPEGDGTDVVLDLRTPPDGGWELALVEDGADPRVLVGDEEVAGGTPQVALVAEAVAPPPGQRLVLTAAGCTAEVPTTGPISVVTVDGVTCTAAAVDSVPALTVPPEWSLRRRPDVRCTIPSDGTAEDASQCLGDAQTSDGATVAEWWSTDDEGRPVVWRVSGLRDVDLVHPGTDGRPWTIEQCVGVALLDLVPGPEADGCAPPEEMPLEP